MNAKWLSKNAMLVLHPEVVIIYDSSGWPRSVVLQGVLLFYEYFYLKYHQSSTSLLYEMPPYTTRR